MTGRRFHVKRPRGWLPSRPSTTCRSRRVAALTALLALQATDPTASTTVRDPAAAVDRHVADSLSALALGERARRAADRRPRLRRGLAGARPRGGAARTRRSSSSRARSATAATSSGRSAEAGLANVAVVHARAEEWPDGIGAHDLVTARALAALPVLCEYAAPLLADGGALVAWKGAVEPAELADGRAAARDPRPRAVRAAPGGPVRGRARPHAPRVPQDRAHARAVPPPARDRDETAPVRRRLCDQH